MNDRALKVLEQYELEVLATRRGRGSYIIETTQGLRILSDYSGSENKARFQNCLMQHIRENGYEKVDLILPDKEGNLIVKDWEENRYVVKEWYTGRECDTSNETEIMAAVRNLAVLHKRMHLEQETGFETNFTALPPFEEARAQNAELRKIRSFVRRKNPKCDFERQFLDSFPVYYEQAQEAERRLAASEKMKRPLTELGIKSVCHGDYDHHHVLIGGYEMATTGFECCRFDYQINDLYRFMRKILEKQNWNLKLGMHILENYAEIRPITTQERWLLYVKLLYPEKFRKLANHYFGSNKAWISRRYLDKLNLLNQQEEKREKFVKMLER